MIRIFVALLGLGVADGMARALAPVPKDAAKVATEVHAVGVYEGTLPPGVRGGGRMHPQGNVTVKVPAGTGPIVLVLTSYEPVLWTIDAPKGAVARVIASGYHGQQVVGLASEVPITLRSHEAGDPDAFYAYQQGAAPGVDKVEQTEAKRDYERLVEQVKKLTRHDVKSFQGAYHGTTFEIR